MDDLEKFYRREVRKRDEEIDFLRSTLYELVTKDKPLQVTAIPVQFRTVSPPAQEQTGKTDIDNFVKSLLDYDGT